MNKLSWLIILSITLLLNGCGLSWFIKPEEQAVVDERIFSSISDELRGTGLHAASTKVERRLVLFNREKKPRTMGKTGYDYVLTVCAESPPEATQALTSIFSAATSQMSAKNPTPAGDNLSQKPNPLPSTPQGLPPSLASALSTAVDALFKRTQGLQFYRDSAYQLCQAHLNGLIKKKNGMPCDDCFLTRLKELEKRAQYLIALELLMKDHYRENPPKEPKESPFKKLIEGETKKIIKKIEEISESSN